MMLVHIPQAGCCERCGEPAALVLDEDIYFMQCEVDDRHCRLLWPSASPECPRSDGPEPEWFTIGGYHAEALARATGGHTDPEQWRAKMVEEARALDVTLDFGELQRIWSSPVVRFVIRYVNRELGRR